LSTSGQLAEAREWMERLPSDLLAGDAQLRLVAASILAFSDRNAESQRFAGTVLDDPSVDPRERVAALRIASGAAAWADQLDEIPPLLPHWPMPGEPGAATLYTVTRLNVIALLALQAGDTAQARAALAEAATHGDAGPLRLAAGLGRMLLGLSHLWDGEATRAEEALRPALARAERDEGRRSLCACLLAAVMAEAMVQGGRIEDAQALLANRVDVLERSGLPDTLECAYRSLARIALYQGDERRALSVLDDQCRLAEQRGLPRLRVAALAEQVRIHALQGHIETTEHLLESLAEMAPVFDAAPMRWAQPQYRLAVALARAQAALARHDAGEADVQLTVADELSRALRRGRDAQVTKLLRAVVARQRDGSEAVPLMAEALSLARLSGNERLLAEAPTAAADMVEEARRVQRGGPRMLPGFVPRVQSAAASARRARAALPRSGLLTTKEAEIMTLLQKGMSNKQIARILDVSGETVKWHLKNLFLKLSAGTRKHAVDRARLLGIVE
jgi:LuxR family maltose regulon positive regulatory protein